MSFRWLIWTFLSPSQILVLSAVLGGLLLASGRDRAGKLWPSLAGVGLLVFGLLPTAHLLGQPLELRFPQPAIPARITGIILLSGAERPSGNPGLRAAAAQLGRSPLHDCAAIVCPASRGEICLLRRAGGGPEDRSAGADMGGPPAAG